MKDEWVQKMMLDLLLCKIGLGFTNSAAAVRFGICLAV
jgi:hypothetical protein